MNRSIEVAMGETRCLTRQIEMVIQDNTLATEDNII